MVVLWVDEDYDKEKMNELLKVSTPKTVVENAIKYFNNPDIKVYLSPHKNKKYSIYNPNTKKLTSFGDIRYEDFTYHKNLDRQKSYLNRAMRIKGNWKDDPYSANSLSIHLLWM
jgi:hypothetical protein